MASDRETMTRRAAEPARGAGQLSLAQIRAVEAVARLGSFTQASVELGVSQPTISMQVRAFEELCNRRIFVRTGGSVTIAPGSDGLMARVRIAVKSVTELDQQIAGQSELRAGTLSLGFSAHRIIMPIMRRFVDQHPGVALQARSGSSADLIGGIQSGALDIASVTLREVDRRFVCHLVSRKGFVVYGPRRHPLLQGRGLDIRRLDGVPMVLWNRGSHTRQVFEEEANRTGITLRCALEVGSWDAAFASIAAGIGLGIALDGEVEADERVSVAPLTGGTFDVGQFLICLPECRDFAAVDAFFQIATAAR